MLAVQRARVILQQLSLHQTISLTDLCQITGASQATIRRDLKALAQQRRLVRVHGGAASLDEEEGLEQEPDLTAMLRYTEEKKRIARYAASLVAEDDVVYLDAGTTVLHLADSSKFGLVTATTILPLDAAQIITNSLPDRKYLDYTKVTVV